MTTTIRNSHVAVVVVVSVVVCEWCFVQEPVFEFEKYVDLHVSIKITPQ